MRISSKCVTHSVETAVWRLCEELCAIEHVAVDKRQHPGADTDECGVCVAQIHEK